MELALDLNSDLLINSSGDFVTLDSAEDINFQLIKTLCLIAPGQNKQYMNLGIDLESSFNGDVGQLQSRIIDQSKFIGIPVKEALYTINEQLKLTI